MLQAAKQCNKVRGAIVSRPFEIVTLTFVTAAVLRLRAPAAHYAQDDT